MSGRRQARHSTLRTCNSNGDEASGQGVASSQSSWLGAVVRLLRCNGKKWHGPDRSATPSETLETKNSEKLDFSWLASNAASKAFKILLVFPRHDQQSEILAGVTRKLGWSVSEARNAEEAVELFRSCRHDLAIVDRRVAARSQDADQICRTLIEISTSTGFHVVALVRKTYFTISQKDEEPILQLLNVGYCRALMECSHKGILMNELIGIYVNEAQPKNQIAAAQLLYFAWDSLQDIVHVTNDEYVLQFSNKASEAVLGFKAEELAGSKVQDFATFDNFTLLQEQLRRGREFVGEVVWKSKAEGTIKVNCTISPFNIPISKTAYYVYRYDITSKYEPISSSMNFHTLAEEETTQPKERHSFESITSYKPRRSTVTKLHNLLLDSPITKVISLLSSAAGQGSVDPDVSEKIETAIKILKNTELYAPRLREDDPLPVSDPIISDLLESLISVSNDTHKSGTTPVRKHSTQKILYPTLIQTQAKLLKNAEISSELEELLETNFEWGFDIFKLESLTNRRPLYFLGMTLMDHYRVAERLDCDEKTMQNWLTIMEANYNIHVSYHNSTHATDVLQAIACFMRSKRLQMILDPLDEVAALIAAVTHDIGHPGKSSQFLCNANNKLAILYNDLSVLESHHSALTFKVTLSDDNVNIFKNLNRDVYKSLRQNIIDMILATEMTKHFEHLAKFVNVYSNRINVDNELIPDEIDTSMFLLPENVTLTKRMMIKCADVSNPTRPLRHYIEWTRRIAEEYFNQTEEEKRKMMPVMMPMFDRASCSIPKLQIGFVDYIINDMMEAWDEFISIPEILVNMKYNYEKWKEFNEQGITTLEDIVKLQENPDYNSLKN